jgi:hypothetical protein
MLDRNEGAPVANLKDDWQPPPSALPEVRQYRKQLVQHITALPFGVGAGASTYTERSFSKYTARLAYVHNNRNNPIKKNPTDSGSLFFPPEKLGQCFPCLGEDDTSGKHRIVLPSWWQHGERRPSHAMPIC